MNCSTQHLFVTPHSHRTREAARYGAVRKVASRCKHLNVLVTIAVHTGCMMMQAHLSHDTNFGDVLYFLSCFLADDISGFFFFFFFCFFFKCTQKLC